MSEHEFIGKIGICKWCGLEQISFLQKRIIHFLVADGIIPNKPYIDPCITDDEKMIKKALE